VHGRQPALPGLPRGWELRLAGGRPPGRDARDGPAADAEVRRDRPAVPGPPARGAAPGRRPGHPGRLRRGLARPGATGAGPGRADRRRPGRPAARRPLRPPRISTPWDGSRTGIARTGIARTGIAGTGIARARGARVCGAWIRSRRRGPAGAPLSAGIYQRRQPGRHPHHCGQPSSWTFAPHFSLFPQVAVHDHPAARSEGQVWLLLRLVRARHHRVQLPPGYGPRCLGPPKGTGTIPAIQADAGRAHHRGPKHPLSGELWPTIRLGRATDQCGQELNGSHEDWTVRT
jgi:hypothetical protein